MDKERELLSLLLPLEIGDRVEAIEASEEFFGVGDTGIITHKSREDFLVEWNESPTVDKACSRKWYAHPRKLKLIVGESDD